MNITKFSRDRMMLTATRWSVPRDYIEPLYNYLVYGFEPGSFWSAVLANDFMRAVQHSHPGNSIEALKSTVGWIRDNFPEEAYGDSDKVILWQDLESVQRRRILESKDMIYTEQEEIMLALTGTKTYEPIWTN
jgi:hypothetical protein